MMQEDHRGPQVALWNTVITPVLGVCGALNAFRSCCLSRKMILAILTLELSTWVLLESHGLILYPVLSCHLSTDTLFSQALLHFCLLWNVDSTVQVEK